MFHVFDYILWVHFQKCCNSTSLVISAYRKWNMSLLLPCLISDYGMVRDPQPLTLTLTWSVARDLWPDLPLAVTAEQHPGDGARRGRPWNTEHVPLMTMLAWAWLSQLSDGFVVGSKILVLVLNTTWSFKFKLSWLNSEFGWWGLLVQTERILEVQRRL